MIVPSDMIKIECPFVRKEIDGAYIVTPDIEPGYEWMFEDPTVLAIEKLHGTNVSVIIEDGTIKSVWNRTERLPFFNKGKRHVIDGIQESYSRGYLDLPDGQWFGELIGPKVNGNPYQLDKHIWIPFSTYAREHLAYKSWGKYPKDFNTISEWFKELQPLYWWKVHGQNEVNGKKPFAEGIVFTHPDGRMAKLRVDMMPWFTGQRHKEGEADKQ